MSVLHAYWWSPTRSARTFAAEMRRNGSGWMRLGAQSHRPPTNFGDELTPLVLELATGRRVRWAPVQSADIIAVGSIIERYLRRGGPGQIWGAGLREGMLSPALSHGMEHSRFLAVRGPMTRKALELPEDLPLGDPGLVAASYGRTSRPPRSGILLIPHFRTFMSAEGIELLRVARRSGVQVIPPSHRPLDVLAAIRAADLVLTSSLHGLVLADALSARVQLVSTTAEDHDEPDFKFSDYGESVGSVAQRCSLQSALSESRRSVLWKHADQRASSVARVIPGVVDRLLESASDICAA